MKCFCIVLGLSVLFDDGMAQVRRIEISPNDTITLLQPQVIVKRFVKETFFKTETEVLKFDSQDQIPIADKQLFDWMGGLVSTRRPKLKGPCDDTEFQNMMAGLIYKNKKRYDEKADWNFSFNHSLDCLPIDHDKPAMFLYMEVGPEMESGGYSWVTHSYTKKRKFRMYWGLCVLIDPRDGRIMGLNINDASASEIISKGLSEQIRFTVGPFVKELDGQRKNIR